MADHGTARKCPDILDDGKILGDEADDGPPAQLESEEAGGPVDDALVDPDAETVDVRDLPPRDIVPRPPVPRAPSRADRRDQRRENRTSAQQAGQEVVRAMARREDEGLRDWIETITRGQAAIRIKLKRLQPHSHQGVQCSGMLETLTHTIDEDFIKENHGGGKFSLEVLRQGPNGDFKYFKSTQVDIAGDPKVSGLKIRDDAAPAPAGNEGKVTDRILDMLDRDRARASEAPRGPDMTLIKTMLEPMQRQIDQYQKTIEQRDKEIAALRDKPQDPSKDRILDKLIDGDNARVTAIKTQHDSEINTLRANAHEDLKRVQDRADRELDRVQRQSEREIADLKAASIREIQFMKETHARELAAMKQGYEAQISQLTLSQTLHTKMAEGEGKRLERENDRLSKENAELRAKKDQSIGEKVKELKAVKELLTDDDAGDEDKGIIGKFLESPMAGKVIEKIGGVFGQGPASGAPPAGAQVQGPMDVAQIPPGVPFQLGDGRIAIKDQQGKIRIKRSEGGAPAPAPAAGAGGVPGVDPADIKAAVAFMEGAFRSSTDPKIFAASIRNSVPPSVLGLVSTHGVDEFFDKVAGLEPGSPLAQQTGRIWARKVAKALVGNDDE